MLPDDQRMTILSPMIRLVAQQEQPLGDMINLLKGVDDKGDWIEATINSLEELKENYASFDPETKIKEGKGNEVLNDEALQRLTKQIASIRENVVY